MRIAAPRASSGHIHTAGGAAVGLILFLGSTIADVAARSRPGGPRDVQPASGTVHDGLLGDAAVASGKGIRAPRAEGFAWEMLAAASEGREPSRPRIAGQGRDPPGRDAGADEGSEPGPSGPAPDILAGLAKHADAIGWRARLEAGRLLIRSEGPEELLLQVTFPPTGPNFEIRPWRLAGRLGIRFLSADIDVDTAAGLVFAFRDLRGEPMRFGMLFLAGDGRVRLASIVAREDADPETPLAERLDLERVFGEWSATRIEDTELTVERDRQRWRFLIDGRPVHEEPLSTFGEGEAGVLLFDEGSSAQFLLAQLSLLPARQEPSAADGGRRSPPQSSTGPFRPEPRGRPPPLPPGGPYGPPAPPHGMPGPYGPPAPPYGPPAPYGQPPPPYYGPPGPYGMPGPYGPPPPPYGPSGPYGRPMPPYGVPGPYGMPGPYGAPMPPYGTPGPYGMPGPYGPPMPPAAPPPGESRP